MRIKTPLWLEDPLDPNPNNFIDRECAGEIKIPETIRENLDFSECMKWLSKVSRYAEFELKEILDERSYKKSR